MVLEKSHSYSVKKVNFDQQTLLWKNLVETSTYRKEELNVKAKSKVMGT